MSKALENSEPYIRLLARSSAKRRKLLLNQATREELKSLCEICLNILKGNIPLGDTNFRRLNRNCNTIKALANKRISLKIKKGIVNQKGGFLGTVASIALPLLASLFTQ